MIFDQAKGYGFASLTQDRSAGIFGNLKRNKITISIAKNASYEFWDNIDGVYDTLTKNYLIDAIGLFGEYIPDTSIQIIGQNITTNFSNNTLSFETKESSIIIRCTGYQDLEIKLPNSFEEWQLIMIHVTLKPILPEFETNYITLAYDKKTKTAKLKDFCYRV